MKGNLTSLDVAWFTKNQTANFRLRRPGAGEVAEVARRFGEGAYYDLAQSGGVLPPPTSSVEWWIMVVKVDRDTTLRLLTLRDVGTAEAPAPEFSCYAVAAFQRVAIDRR